MAYKTINNVDCKNKRVLVRVDLNVPMKGFVVSDSTRLKRIRQNIGEILNKGGKPIIIGHLGRPAGKFSEMLSLRNIVPELTRVLGLKVHFCEDLIGTKAINATKQLETNSILVMENTRFYKEEEENDAKFSEKLSQLGDIFCNDAFSVCHRAHASTLGITNFLPSFAGSLVLEELRALELSLTKPKRPVTAIIGGSKVSTKIELLNNLMSKVDNIIIGGGMANTFLLANGNNIGKSISEPHLVSLAKDIYNDASLLGCNIHLPIDIITSKSLNECNVARTFNTKNCPNDEMIFDCGEKSAENYCKLIRKSKTIVWNGPLGVFEQAPFHLGTKKIAQAIAIQTKRYGLNSIAGGGDTVAALNQFNLSTDLSYLSAAGGAFLEWLEGKKLPGIEVLQLKK